MSAKAVGLLLLLLAVQIRLKGQVQIIHTALLNEQQVRYGVAQTLGSTYFWQVQDGTITSGQQTHEIYVNWGSVPGLKRISLIEFNVIGCLSDTAIAWVLLSSDTLPDSLPFVMPNSFTPNGDGLNDAFGVAFPFSDLTNFRLIIYNRWGELVYEANDPTQPWDGTTKGFPCAMDAYVWKLEISRRRWKSVSMSGMVTLMR